MKVIEERPAKWKLYFYPNSEGGEFADYDGDKEKFDWTTKKSIKAEVRENFLFEATLVPDEYYRGRSAAGFFFRDKDSGTRFTMRISRVADLLKAFAEGKVVTENGGFKGRFTFEKQGSNYTIRLITE